MPIFATLLLAACAMQRSSTEPSQGPSLPPIRLASDHHGFVVGPDSAPFSVWGLNYDHDDSGQLLEDYWITDWDRVLADLGEMRDLGANVVRLHLQVSRFLEAADRAHEPSLERLGRLLDAGQALGLRFDLTGLGCYHADDVPAWYDALDEAGRWSAQECFWTAVARCGAEHGGVFCYDLMNEPVVPGPGDRRESWLGPPFAGKCFVQFVTRELGDRERPEVARAWTERMAAAVRAQDPRTLVTVGLVDWSLDRPGLTSGFSPAVVAPAVDFLCVHLYPEAGKVDAATGTLEAFASFGVPVVVEETFPLRCSPEEFDEFLERAAPVAAGFVGFYWGRTLAECRSGDTIQDALLVKWLERFARGLPAGR